MPFWCQCLLQEKRPKTILRNKVKTGFFKRYLGCVITYLRYHTFEQHGKAYPTKNDADEGYNHSSNYTFCRHRHYCFFFLCFFNISATQDNDDGEKNDFFNRETYGKISDWLSFLR